MKRILSTVITVALLLSLCTFTSVSAATAAVGDELVIEDGETGWAEDGTWTLSTSNKVATHDSNSTDGHRYSSSGSIIVTPQESALAEGKYDVYWWNAWLTTACSTVTWTVVCEGGKTTQTGTFEPGEITTSGTGAWHKIGNFVFTGNGKETVTFSKIGGTGTFRADATKFVVTELGDFVIPDEPEEDDGVLTIDHHDATQWVESGTWTRTTNANLLGYDGVAEVRSTSTSGSYVTIKPTSGALATGTYDVEWWSNWFSTSTTSVSWEISYNGGTETATGTFNPKKQQDQSTDNAVSNGYWYNFGNYTFTGNGNEYLKITHSASGTLRADAGRFTYKEVSVEPEEPEVPEEEEGVLTIDHNDKAQWLTTGVWDSKNSIAGYDGEKDVILVNDNSNATLETITIKPLTANFPSGTYTVEWYNLWVTTSATSVTWEISYNGGKQTATGTFNPKKQQDGTTDLTGGNGYWRNLGSYSFTGNGNEYVKIINSTTGKTWADAARFTRTGDAIVDESTPIIIDHNNTEYYAETGAWRDVSHSYLPGYDGVQGIRSTTEANATVTVTPATGLFTAGVYEVAWWNDWYDSTSPIIQYEISYNGGASKFTGTFTPNITPDGTEQIVPEEQVSNPPDFEGYWRSFGKFYFAGTGNEYLKITNLPFIDPETEAEVGGTFRADAAKFTPLVLTESFAIIKGGSEVSSITAPAATDDSNGYSAYFKGNVVNIADDTWKLILAKYNTTTKQLAEVKFDAVNLTNEISLSTLGAVEKTSPMIALGDDYQGWTIKAFLWNKSTLIPILDNIEITD